jgi:hypothetical protein
MNAVGVPQALIDRQLTKSLTSAAQMVALLRPCFCFIYGAALRYVRNRKQLIYGFVVAITNSLIGKSRLALLA